MSTFHCAVVYSIQIVIDEPTRKLLTLSNTSEAFGGKAD